jgi:hypothetical protein
MNIVREQNNMFRNKVLTFKMYVICKLKLCEYDFKLILILNTPVTLKCETQINITKIISITFRIGYKRVCLLFFYLLSHFLNVQSVSTCFFINLLTKLANLTIVKYKPHC